MHEYFRLLETVEMMQKLFIGVSHCLKIQRGNYCSNLLRSNTRKLERTPCLSYQSLQSS